MNAHLDTSQVDISARVNAQAQWNAHPCGAVGEEAGTLKYFERVVAYRLAIQSWTPEYFGYGRFGGQKVLEIGMGQGSDLLQFAKGGAECFGVDITDAHLELARRNFELHGFKADFRRADAVALPFADASFDCVYSFGVLHHIPEIERVLAEIRRVLKPGRLFMVALYHKWSLPHLMLLVRGIWNGGLWQLGYDGLKATVELGADGITIKPYVRLYGRRELRALLHDFAIEDISVHQLGDNWPPAIAAAMNFLSHRIGWYVTAKARVPQPSCPPQA